jgi:hypothetical protein
MLSTRPRRIMVALVVIFAIYAVLNQPTTAADGVQGFFNWVAKSLDSISKFFNALLAG